MSYFREYLRSEGAGLWAAIISILSATAIFLIIVVKACIMLWNAL